MADDLPYRAEYAKSNRSSCKACKSQIAKETLRLAVMVQSPMFDGKVPHWYHYMCFFGKQRPKTVGDIAHYESLRYEDQEKIKSKVGSGDGAGAVASGDASGKSKATKRGAGKVDPSLKDFSVEYAKSGRATCCGCEQKIMKDEIRISKKDYESDTAKRYGPVPRWHHVECFAKLRDELEYWETGDKLPGIKTLSKEDQQTVKGSLPKTEKKEKPKDEADGPTPAKKLKPTDDNEEQIKTQSKLMYKYRDLLKSQLSKKNLQLLLEYNEQEVPVGEDRILDRLADVMTFGALLPCEACKGGQYVYRSGTGYMCIGDLTEWTKCQTVTTEPKRKKFKVPKELKEEHDFLNKYKCVVGKRIMQNIAPSTPKATNGESSGPKIQRAAPPLLNMEFVIIGKTATSRSDLKKKIEKLGGKVGKKIHGKLAAIISTADQVEKMNEKMEEAKDHDIQVVPEDYLDEAKDGSAVLLITKKSICSWGSDPGKRIVVDTVDAKKKSKSGSMFTKSMPTSVKLKLKGGTAVDPDSKLDDIAHVYKKNDDVYSAVLGITDIQTGKNSYYKLQVLESDKGSRYWFFRSWGRIGTTIGDNRVEKMDTLHDALQRFDFYYEDKTGNMWKNRKNFMKVPGRMYPIDLDYGQDEETLPKIESADIKSELAVPVQELVKVLFDVDLMKKVMLEFELDLQKMPLGKLSKKQIQKAYSVLTKLQDLVKEDKSSMLIIDHSNQFYTLVPHDFGVDNPPPLNNDDIIKKKVEMLDNLMEIEIAYSLLKLKSDDDGKTHPLDAHYSKLNTHIEVLDRTSEEFELLAQYVKNTHAETHASYELEILEVFKVRRSGEDKRYKPFRKLHNRKLLWHGSRLTNFAGILSQGLRIAPPEAPVTGYMFGKGIYFADMVSKSANYCCTSPQNPTGLLLLCEVALGNMYELPNAQSITKLPKDKHSTKGLGRTEPDPSAVVTREDGVDVPVGKGVATEHKNVSLLYNEYIVYDVAQVNIQYLFKMKFKYNF